jgi:hypothetical protein
VKGILVGGFDGANPTLLQNAPPKIQSSTTTEINRPQKSNKSIYIYIYIYIF